jgi:hypothetical protein
LIPLMDPMLIMREGMSAVDFERSKGKQLMKSQMLKTFSLAEVFIIRTLVSNWRCASNSNSSLSRMHPQGIHQQEQPNWLRHYW